MKKLTLFVLLLLVSMIMSTSASVEEEKNQGFSTENIYSQEISLDQSNIWYQESASINFSPEGYIWAHASMQGNVLQFSNLELVDLIPSEIRDTFDWAGISVHQGSSPTDLNLGVNMRFKTNQPDLAEAYAMVILNAIGSQIQIINLEFEGSQGYDENYGNGFQGYTDVYYRGHVDWTNMKLVMNNSVPRSYGGLAATIDVTQASDLFFDVWYSGGNNLYASIGVAFSDFVDILDGGHEYFLEDLLHVTNFSVASYASNFNLHISLPTVSNLAFSISNSTNTEVNIETFESDEPQNDHSTTLVNIWLSGSASYNSISINFDYEFVLWEWKNRENILWNIDDRGYSQIELGVTGLTKSGPTFNLLANQSIFENSINLWFSIDYPSTVISGNHNFYLDMQFPQDTTYNDANQTMQAVASELESLGIVFSDNWNTNWGVEDERSWYDRNQTEIYIEGITYAGFLDSRAQFEGFIENSYVYSKTATISATDLSNIDNFYWYQNDAFVDRASSIHLKINPLHWGNANPTTTFTQNADDLTGVDLFRPVNLGWSGGFIPWNENSDQVSIFFEAPFINSFDEILFDPDTNNGYAWSSGRWTQESNDRNRFSFDLHIYDANPQIQDYNNGDPINLGPLEYAVINFTTHFYGDNVDLEAPFINNMWYQNDSIPGVNLPDYRNYHRMYEYNPKFSGTQDFSLEVYDQSNTYWNGSNYVPRYPSSGIQNTTSYFYRVDAPIDHSLFTQSLEFTHNSSWINDDPNHQVWDATLDTTQLPDGEWQLVADTFDNNDNFASYHAGVIEIDNYDDSYLPAEISWNEGTPQEGEGVADIVHFNFTVSDDIGLYAVIAWNNLGGYLLDTVDTLTNSSGTYYIYSFTVDVLAQQLPENYPFTITIEVLDMDGHWSNLDLSVFVDNHPIGNPPLIELISPGTGTIVDNTETNMVLFTTNVTDDVGIQSVKLQLIGPVDREFSMFYNEITGLYEYEADISTWSLGEYNWNVEVIDQDENQHTTSSNTSFTFEIIGDPVGEDSERPEISLLSHVSGQTVSGVITIEVQATDNLAISQVSFTDPDGTEFQMQSSGSETYFAEWDSASVVDGSVELTVTARDSSGNTEELRFNLITSNGRTASAPEIGLSGFGGYISLLSLVLIVPIIKRRTT